MSRQYLHSSTRDLWRRTANGTDLSSNARVQGETYKFLPTFPSFSPLMLPISRPSFYLFLSFFLSFFLYLFIYLFLFFSIIILSLSPSFPPIFLLFLLLFLLPPTDLSFFFLSFASFRLIPTLVRSLFFPNVHAQGWHL